MSQFLPACRLGRSGALRQVVKSSLGGFLLVLLGSVSAAGQVAQRLPGISASPIHRQLQSNDATEVAWGAFEAAKYHVVSAVPLLTANLVKELQGDAYARQAAELAILDALVQLGAQVPVDVLRSSFDRWPVPTLILLGNATGNRDALLLEYLNATSGIEWQAIANLLLQTEPPGFAFQLLNGLELRLHIYLTDASSAIGIGYGGGMETGPNYSIAVPGFPPLPDYQLSGAAVGATVLSIGPETVYYTRRIAAGVPSFRPQIRSTSEKPADLDRVRYVNALVRKHVEAMPLPATTPVTIIWTDALTFRDDVSRHRSALETRYREIASLLAWTKDVTEGERQSLYPTIRIAVEDYRRDKSTPLPTIEGR